MIDFTPLLEFSRQHCLTICAGLVPLNLLATLLTMILAALSYPHHRLWQSAGVAWVFAIALVLHVWSWFIIGVVAIPTFVLMALGITCISINAWLVWQPEKMVELISWVRQSWHDYRKLDLE
ncbi:hypothetical protein [Pantanalinema sp. GBBB05]|uniref:hypothetical protein n=1 Tax=Pantanalinema sp. GBBB05 TaxID=2604139 RepID=UPI001D4AAD25|nr:hypothetical protein [Pantanalinema sp. GBBB05]